MNYELSKVNSGFRKLRKVRYAPDPKDDSVLGGSEFLQNAGACALSDGRKMLEHGKYGSRESFVIRSQPSSQGPTSSHNLSNATPSRLQINNTEDGRFDLRAKIALDRHQGEFLLTEAALISARARGIPIVKKQYIDQNGRLHSVVTLDIDFSDPNAPRFNDAQKWLENLLGPADSHPFTREAFGIASEIAYNRSFGINKSCDARALANPKLPQPWRLGLLASIEQDLKDASSRVLSADYKKPNCARDKLQESLALSDDKDDETSSLALRATLAELLLSQTELGRSDGKECQVRWLDVDRLYGSGVVKNIKRINDFPDEGGWAAKGRRIIFGNRASRYFRNDEAFKNCKPLVDNFDDNVAGGTPCLAAIATVVSTFKAQGIATKDQPFALYEMIAARALSEYVFLGLLDDPARRVVFEERTSNAAASLRECSTALDNAYATKVTISGHPGKATDFDNSEDAEEPKNDDDVKAVSHIDSGNNDLDRDNDDPDDAGLVSDVDKYLDADDDLERDVDSALENNVDQPDDGELDIDQAPAGYRPWIKNSGNDPKDAERTVHRRFTLDSGAQARFDKMYIKTVINPNDPSKSRIELVLRTTDYMKQGKLIHDVILDLFNFRNDIAKKLLQDTSNKLRDPNLTPEEKHRLIELQALLKDAVRDPRVLFSISHEFDDSGVRTGGVSVKLNNSFYGLLNDKQQYEVMRQILGTSGYELNQGPFEAIKKKLTGSSDDSIANIKNVSERFAKVAQLEATEPIDELRCRFIMPKTCDTAINTKTRLPLVSLDPVKEQDQLGGVNYRPCEFRDYYKRMKEKIESDQLFKTIMSELEGAIERVPAAKREALIQNKGCVAMAEYIRRREQSEGGMPHFAVLSACIELSVMDGKTASKDRSENMGALCARYALQLYFSELFNHEKYGKPFAPMKAIADPRCDIKSLDELTEKFPSVAPLLSTKNLQALLARSQDKAVPPEAVSRVITEKERAKAIVGVVAGEALGSGNIAGPFDRDDIIRIVQNVKDKKERELALMSFFLAVNVADSPQSARYLADLIDGVGIGDASRNILQDIAHDFQRSRADLCAQDPSQMSAQAIMASPDIPLNSKILIFASHGDRCGYSRDDLKESLSIPGAARSMAEQLVNVIAQGQQIPKPNIDCTKLPGFDNLVKMYQQQAGPSSPGLGA